VVGSWWPQAEYEADLQRLHRGKVSDEERETILSGSAQKAISQQMALVSLVDRRRGISRTILEPYAKKVLTGIGSMSQTSRYCLITTISPTQKLRARSTPERHGLFGRVPPRKALHGGVQGNRRRSLKWHSTPWSVSTAHGAAANLIGVVNAEIRGLAAAGCPNIQLDVPHVRR
jgi:hypothetical protein